MNLQMYSDLLAKVRHDDRFHPIRQLVQPLDPEVRAVAEVLLRSDNFVLACQDFVDSFTTYKREVGDYWAMPAEMLRRRAGDCDDKAILLASLLRNRTPPTDVFCAFGTWQHNGRAEGHMWVVMKGGMEDRILESTASSHRPLKGKYNLQALFNDQYAFSYPAGIKEFDLIPVQMEVSYV